MGSLEKPLPVPIEEVLREVHPPMEELEGWRQKELANSLEELEKHDSICLVGDPGAGKSFFVVHKLVPALKERGEKIAVLDPFVVESLSKDAALEKVNLATLTPGVRNQLRPPEPGWKKQPISLDEVHENPIFRKFLDYYFCPLKDATVVVIDEAHCVSRLSRSHRDAELLKKLEGKKVIFVGEKDGFRFLDYLRGMAEREGIALDIPAPEDKQRIIEFV